MDSITQAALGAAVGEAVLGKRIGVRGAVLGALVATVPDLDIVFYLFFDKYEMLSIHRGMSHSIFFSLIGALIIALILKRIKWTREMSYLKLWLFSWITLFTHILLDAFTAYGTQLFLPFSNQRVGFDSINVVDPVYTIPLLVGLICSIYFFKRKPSRSLYNYAGIVVSSFYLLCTLGVKQHVKKHFLLELAEQNISHTALLTMPVGVAGVNWYGVAKTDEGLYMHKYSIISDEHPPFEYFPINDHLLADLNPVFVNKMKWFSKGFYTVAEHQNAIRFYNLQVDMRGVVHLADTKAPTAGYFEIVPREEGGFEFSSGAHK